MRITEARIKQTISDFLTEDLAGFMDKSKDISYRGFVQDPTFDLDWNKKNKAAARSVKQIWSQEADHEFMSKVIKIHWLKRAGLEEKLQGFLSMSGRNEISTMGYLPGSDTFMANWGPIGVVVEGRTTLAANRMSTLMSGYGGSLSPETTVKYTPSGVPRRSTFFAGTAVSPAESLAGEYILDRASFDPAGQGGNEFIVGNWTPIGVALAKPVREIMFNQAMGDMYTGVKETEIGGYIAAAESTGLPWTSEEDEFNVRLWKDRVGSKQQVNESVGGIPWQEQVFGDARGTWRVGDLYDYASNMYDLQKIPVSALEENNLDDGGQTTSDESEEAYVSRAMESNLDYPIIVVNYPDGLWIADGTHRTWKARELGVPYMQGWILDWEEILDVPHSEPMPESLSSPY